MRRDGKQNMTVLYSVMHLLVDGMCALAMFGVFLPRENGYLYILLYNFCAFALQMPVGAALDALGGRSGRNAFLTAASGVLCTIAGAVVHPVVLGIGNALFHVGAGVGVIREDSAKGWRGRGLGIFVAPGALGLYLGTLAAKSGAWNIGGWSIGILMALLCAAGKRRVGFYEEAAGAPAEPAREERLLGRDGEPGASLCREEGSWKIGAGNVAWTMLCCMAVVILRSHIGMTVAFPWKSGITAGIMAVLAVAGGKAAGGFAAAKWGMRRTAAVSLGAASLGYLFSSVMPVGLAAVFLFNMTMPITLYWMVCRMPDNPGFAFGFLTFALFLGFLPGYFGMAAAVEASAAGCGGSVLSLLLLLAGMGRRRKWELT